MENLINIILSNPVYMAIGVAIVIILIFFIIKKLFKLCFYALAILVLFLVYVKYTGGDIAETINTAKEDGVEMLNQAK